MFLTFLIFSICSCIGAAKDISVNPGESIQAAVNSAQTGDVIILGAGNYSENIAINRANVEIKSASGNPADVTISANDTTKDVIAVTSRSNLKISGLTIKGAGADRSGILLDSCRDCTLENNKFVNDGMGAFIRSSVNCVVRNNAANRDSGIGTGRAVNVERSYYTIVSGNTISDYRFGIYISGSEGNTVTGNTISQSLANGIQFENTRNTVLESNTVSSSGNKGIYLKDSGRNTIRNNAVSSSKGNGIDIETSPTNTVSGNTVTGNPDMNNTHGLFLNTCTDNIVQGNTVSVCEYGYAMRYSQNNSIINNNMHDNFRGFYVSYTSSRNTLTGNKANANTIGFVVERGAYNNILQNNDASSNKVTGFALDNANNNRIINNIASFNSRGIYLGPESRENIVSGNTLNSNSANGVLLENASANDIINNIISSSNINGVYLAGLSNNNNIINNKVQSNRVGLYVLNSTGNMLSQNTVTDNVASGIMLSLASNNTISRNIAINNFEGVTLNSSESNNVSSNNISSNGNGVYLCPRSISNLIYDNYFNNPSNANVKNNRSYWNIERTSGRNIMGGRYLGGNYWATPSGMGFSETSPDNDGDGIIDVPFIPENGNIRDELPLAFVVVPIASFNANVIDGIAPLTVYFYDFSQNANSLNWDFGDKSAPSSEKNPVHTYETIGNYTVRLTATNGNGSSIATKEIYVHKLIPVANFNSNLISGGTPLSVQFTDTSQNTGWRTWYFGDGSTSNEQNPVHIYAAEGTYNVFLSASNENGTVSKNAMITVKKAGSSEAVQEEVVVEEAVAVSSGSGGSSKSGGGGGAGGSPEAQSNVEVKELSQSYVSSSQAANFTFSKKATCVEYVCFDSKKTFGKTTTIAEMLKGKSNLVSQLPEGEVYKSINVWVGSGGVGTAKNIENAVICFKVDKAWIKDKKIDKESIILNRYATANKKWEELHATLSNRR